VRKHDADESQDSAKSSAWQQCTEHRAEQQMQAFASDSVVLPAASLVLIDN
jgi:hypothetical protein